MGPDHLPLSRGLTFAILLTLLFIPQRSAAQTVSGFTNSSGWSGLKVGSVFLTDAYDAGSSNLDVTKQSSISGSNSVWDLVGNTTIPLFQVAEGTITSSGAAANAWSVRLGDYRAQGLGNGNVGLLLADTTGYYGYALSFASNGSVSLYRIKPNDPITLTPSGFTYTYGNNAAANNSSALTASGVLHNYEQITTGTQLSATTDAWLTFVIPLSEIRTFTGNSSWTYNSSVGATAFTGTQQVNTNINADYAGTSTTALSFGAQSGTVVAAAVPEIPTAVFSAGLILPLAAFRAWRRRRVASGSQSA